MIDLRGTRWKEVYSKDDLASEIHRLAARVAELEALIGTVRSIAGCEIRTVRDIGVEQHSREIGARFAELAQDAARWRWWREQRSAALVARTPQQADALADAFIEEGRK